MRAKVIARRVTGGAESEADAVVARQVGARLGRRDEIVDRNRRAGVRQVDVDQGGAARDEHVERRGVRGQHLRVDLLRREQWLVTALGKHDGEIEQP